MGFYEKYIETVTKNDVRTRNSVDAIIGRIDELLEDRPDGRQYEAVAGHDAYMPARWDGAMPVDTRLALALVKAAIDFIRKDNNPHESKEVFAKILEDPKLGDFFRAGNPNDFAQFNKLIMDNLYIDGDEAIGEGIALVKRRPITWQYQG